MSLTPQLIVAITAALITLITWALNSRSARRTRRSEFIRNCTNDFYENDNMTSLFMDIDYDRFKYDESILGTDKELDLIRFLDYFNMVGHNWRRGVMPLSDILPTTIGYAVLRTWKNEEIRKYLRQIKVWDAERYSSSAGFLYFEELAIQLAWVCGRTPVKVQRSKLLVSAPPRRALIGRVVDRYRLSVRLYRWWWRVTGHPFPSEENHTLGVNAPQEPLEK
ncbi:hypothetical protein ACIP2Y_35245 [Streptomyces sviceus]|uniref:hypothetical protein n=1 Tax=Streptomyces sviceus TaxID=285530 RepID=UPI00381DA1AD